MQSGEGIERHIRGGRLIDTALCTTGPNENVYARST